MSGYDVALICLNGHVINTHSRTSPEDNTKYCQRCGEATVIACAKCNTNIRGKYQSDTFIDLTRFHPPKFCHQCGEAYPWTIKSREAAAELTALSELSEIEKADLNQAIIEIGKDSPNGKVGAEKVKRMPRKSGEVWVKKF
jgi:hypothetical protein